MPEAKITPSEANLDRGYSLAGPCRDPALHAALPPLSRAVMGEPYRVGVVIKDLPPGSQSAPMHYHLFVEEHVYVLEGIPTLRLGDAAYEMKAGDYVCFPAGQRIGHSFLNSGSGSCSYLMIGERNPNDLQVYPDSNKMDVRALGRERTIFDMSGIRDYLDGEQAI